MGYYGRSSRNSFSWPAYVSVAERREKAAKLVAAEKKKGKAFNPVVIEGRTIAKSFWGKAWCDNLEAYSDYENRLPRGRTYARNGSVIDLQVTPGTVSAQVMGSSLYKISISVTAMPAAKWADLVKACAGKIDSLIELLQGKFSKAVMEIITEKEHGLFPKPAEISMRCSCPDIAGMCKHIAAVLYGIGATLDVKPEWLFTLRHVDQMDLIATASAASTLVGGQEGGNALDDSELSALFGIEMEEVVPPRQAATAKIAKPRGRPKAGANLGATTPKPPAAGEPMAAAAAAKITKPRGRPKSGTK